MRGIETHPDRVRAFASLRYRPPRAGDDDVVPHATNHNIALSRDLGESKNRGEDAHQPRRAVTPGDDRLKLLQLRRDDSLVQLVARAPVELRELGLLIPDRERRPIHHSTRRERVAR